MNTENIGGETAVKTAARKNTPLHFGVCLAKNNMSIGVICLILNILGLPAILLSELIYIGSVISGDTDYGYFLNGSGLYIAIGVLATIGAVLAGAVAAMNSFAHLYSKQKVDMELSLPLSAKQRFVSGYFSGLSVYLLPYIGAQLISLLLLLIGHIAFDGKPLERHDNSELTCTVFADEFIICLKLIIGGLLIMAMFYTMWVLTMTFCGSKLEANLYGIGANFVMPAIYGSAVMIIIQSIYGAVDEYYLTPDSSNPLMMFFFSSSPLMAVVSLAENVTGEFSNMKFIPSALAMAAVTVIFFFAAMFVYRRRKAEDTGKSFAVKGFYYLVLSCMVFFLFTAMTSIGTGIIPFVIVTGTAYIILDSISQRGVRKIGLSVIKYAVTAAVSGGLCSLCIGTGCFGASDRVPSAREISSVTLNYGSGTNSYFDSGNIYLKTPEATEYTFSSKEAIDIITSAHRTQLDVHGRYEYDEKTTYTDEFYDRGPVKLTYRLKNGSTLVRSYRMYNPAREQLLALEGLRETKDNRINNAAEVIKMMAEDNSFSRLNIYDIKSDRALEREVYINRKAFFSEELIDAYTADINAIDEEKAARPAEGRCCGIDFLVDHDGYISSLTNFTLNGNFPNTYKYLEENGVKLPDGDSGAQVIELLYNGGISNISLGTFTPAYSIPVNSRNSNMTEKRLNIFSVYYGYDNTYPYGKEYYTYETDITDMTTTDIYDIMEIITNSIPQYIPTEECYTINVDSGAYTAYIPSRYNETVERIIAEYSTQRYYG